MIPASPGSSQAVREWLAADITGGEPLADTVTYAPVISTESFSVGTSEPEDFPAHGASVCWWGGPAPAGVTPWPTNAVGSPLLHVITLDLTAVDAALDAPSKETWGRALREGLPRQGTLSVFHDGVADGAGAADQRSWAIRYSQSESREPVVGSGLPAAGGRAPPPTPPSRCRPRQIPCTPRPQTTGPITDEARRLTPSGGPDRRMTYLYGHSRFGQEALQPVLDRILPASEANPHRLIASLLTPPFAEWPGEETTLEVWMRNEDLNVRHFEAAWCILRQEGTLQDPS